MLSWPFNVQMKRMKFFYSTIIAICVFGGLLSCENPNEIGFDLNNEISGKPIYSDTLGLDVSTVLSDSTVNGAANYIMAGFSEDPVFGTAKATAYFQPTLKYRAANVIDTFKVKGTNPVADSIRLRIIHTGLLFGDSLAKATFGFYRLKNSMKTSNYDVKESIETEATPLLKFTLTPNSFRNKTRDTLLAYYLTLPKSIANEIIAAATANPTDNGKFISQFKGFAIVPESNAKSLYTFLTGPFGSTTSTLVTYWHTQGDDALKFYEFDLNGPRHSNVVFNRSSTKLSDLTNLKPELPINKTNTLCYVQGGSGMSTKVNFTNLSKLGANVKVSRAVLEFIAPKQYNNLQFAKIYSYAIAEADSRNQHIRNAAKQLTYVTPIGTDLSSGLQKLVDSSNTVSVDLTNLVQKIVNKKQYNTSILLLPAVPTVDGNSVLSNDNLRRMVFLKPKLKIYYTKN
jgi:Domain of unknown function (DUF4270)